ncbi:hypothetical protein FIBSPDRAFT_926827 [Athelia psychrophila]|uniref:MI domain-containing protein n=1 Tax=Athelia psychrophila TaxID=1759441 RepID=A0A166SN25_9AGAM|nr:hypothetical protein FIBSPDRAFT_926827 [Fibularhizoctonia sp. CBS 109695]
MYYPRQWYVPCIPIAQQQHMPPRFHLHPPALKANPACPCLPEILRCHYNPACPRSLPRLPTSRRTPTTAASASPHHPLCPQLPRPRDSTLPGTNSANRLSTYASTFVPGLPRSSKISIKTADGSEVDLKAISSKHASPGLAPWSPSASGFNPAANGYRSRKSQSIRMESEEARKKRVAEEAKADQERAVKEAEEKVKQDAEEKEQREEQARVAAIEKAAEDEEERVRKDEEEKEWIRKEAEEAERVKAEEAERVQQAEADKAREEAAAAQNAAEDGERAKEEEGAAAAAAVTATAEEKEEGEVAQSPSELISDKRKSEARKPRPGPLDLLYGKTPITPGLPSALATARIIEDIEKMEYPEGIMSPKLELNVNAKDSKFKYDRDFLLQLMSICKEKPDQLPPLDAIGLDPVDQLSMRRGGSGRHRTTSMQMGPLGPRAGSIGSIGLGVDNYTEKDGRTLIRVIRLGFEKATDVAAWSEMTMASRTTRASPSKAKRQGLGLIKFIGEWFKLQMLTERIMHECVKKLLGNVENPEEEEIESLCKLLSTVGALLDTPKAGAQMDVYFSRMKELTRSENLTLRMRFMLRDVVELRDRKWNTRNVVAAPTTLAAVHDLANEDRAAAERESVQRMNSMSRMSPRRGGERGQYDQQGPDGWTVTGERGGRGTPCPPPKADDLSNFGKINKAAPMTFGPTSVFAKGKEGAKGPRTEPISRSSSSSNMFSMLSQNSEIAADASGPKPTTSRSASRKTSIDLGTAGLLPQSKMTEDGGDGTAASTPVSENGEVEESGTAADSMSKADAKKHLDQDSKEFFAVRNLDEAEEYFQKLTPEHRFRLADKPVNTAMESKAADAQLVSDFFAQAHSKDLCSEASFEEGFKPIAELLDDIAIDAPKAFDLMAVMVKGASLSEDARGRIAAKSVYSEKLLALLST